MAETEYHVTWEIDAIYADSPEEAARKALEIMQRPDSTANHFIVQAHGSVIEHQIDLQEIDEARQAFTADSLIEAFGDQAYHKAVAMTVECLHGGDAATCRAVSTAARELLARGYHKKLKI